MGHKANRPIYEALVSILETTPGILIQHVKAHGPTQTRAQWGNYYADRIAKGHEDEWADNHIRWPMSELEVFTDGSMQFSNSVASRVLTPPESMRQPVYAQGGILFHFGKSSALNRHEQNITISIERGVDIELLLSSSTEVYSMVLAARLM